MDQDQRRNGYGGAESPDVEVHGTQDDACRRPDHAGTEAPRGEPVSAKALRAVAIRAAKARWSGRKENSAA